jgi:hypothetical protein
VTVDMYTPQSGPHRLQDLVRAILGSGGEGPYAQLRSNGTGDTTYLHGSKLVQPRQVSFLGATYESCQVAAGVYIYIYTCMMHVYTGGGYALRAC